MSFDITGKLKIIDDTKEGLESAKGSITGTFKKIATTAAGFLSAQLVTGLIDVGKEGIQLGAKAETLRGGFEALKGDVDDNVLSLETLRASIDGTVSDVDLLTAANQAMALGLPTEDLNSLFSAAQKVGAAMGRTTLEAVQDLTTGIGRQSRLILDNLGIIVDTNAAYDKFAVTLGKTANELTEDERKTAFMTAAIEALNSKSEILEGTLSETQLAQEKVSAAWTNVKTIIGETLIPVVSDLFTEFSKILTVVGNVINAIKEGDWGAAAEILLDSFRNLGSRLSEALSTVNWTEALVSLGQSIGQFAVAFTTEIINLIKAIDWIEVFKGILAGIGGLFAGLLEGLLGLGGGSGGGEGGGIRTGMSTPYGNITQSYDQLLDVVSDKKLTREELDQLGLTGMSTQEINIHIGNFIGSDEEAATELGNLIARYNNIMELERQGIKP